MKERPVVIIFARDGIRSTMTGDQAAKLRAGGHATADWRSDLTARELENWLAADEQRDVAACDFCDRVGVAWSFPCADHDLPTGDVSVGAWDACERCAALINAGRRQALAERAVRELGFRVSTARLIQDGFWRHRAGAGRRLERP